LIETAGFAITSVSLDTSPDIGLTWVVLRTERSPKRKDSLQRRRKLKKGITWAESLRFENPYMRSALTEGFLCPPPTFQSHAESYLRISRTMGFPCLRAVNQHPRESSSERLATIVCQTTHLTVKDPASTTSPCHYIRPIITPLSVHHISLHLQLLNYTLARLSRSQIIRDIL
jgi:hypothetical protein